MRSKQDMARVVMAAKLVTDHIKDLSETDRRALFDALDADDTERMTVRTDDGIELGKIVHHRGAPKARVTDEPAFTAWVKKTHPDMIREVVDEPYRKKVLKDAEVEGIALDTDTGEVIPGVEMRDSAGYISVRANDAGRNLAKALLLQNGLLKLGQGPVEPEEHPIVEAADISSWPGLDDGSTW